jgi:hypothetical protein
VGGVFSYTDTFDVQGNASAASGYYERFQPSTGVFVRAQVDCLTVVGDAAYMAGVFTETRNANVFAGERFYVSVEDNGESGVGDLVGTIRGGDPTTCIPIPNGGTPIVAGDVVIEVICDNLKDKRNGEDKCKDKD